MQDIFKLFNKTQFFKSATMLSQCPAQSTAEVAIIGRSNTGKSSFINVICNQKSLCRVGKTPGRTQHINFFNIIDNWFIVDLPGFGFAKISKKLQQAWHKELNNYLKKRDALKAVFIIVDIRRDLTPDDEDIIKMAIEYNLLPVIILNKADKISKSAAKNQLMIHQKHYNNEVPCFIFSATKKQGIDAVLEKFYNILVN